MEIVNHGEILIKVREEQYSQLQPGAIHIQPRLLQIALSLLELDLGLDDIGMGNFAALFEFLADPQKAFRFRSGVLGSGILALGNYQAVVSLHYGYHQAPSRDFQARPRCRFHRTGSLVIGETGQRECLMHVGLTNVLVYTIVGYETAREAWVATFGVDELVVVINVWQQGSPSLNMIFFRETQFCEPGLELRTVAFRSLQGILQRQCQRSTAIRTICRGRFGREACRSLHVDGFKGRIGLCNGK